MYGLRLFTGPFTTKGWHSLSRQHRFTHWIIRTVEEDEDDVEIVFESLWDATNLRSITIPPILQEGVEYEVIYAHVDGLNYETWSDPISVNNLPIPPTPTKRRIVMPQPEPLIPELRLGPLQTDLDWQTGFDDSVDRMNVVIRAVNKLIEKNPELAETEDEA